MDQRGAQLAGVATTAEPTATPLRLAVRYGWMPLVALAGTTALESGERQSLAQAVDGIQKSFHVSDFQVSLLPFAMALIGVVGSIPIGRLTDRIRRTGLMGAAMLIWTVCMGLNGVAPSYATLFLARLGVGSVEANGPAAISLLSDYYPAKDRARIFGLYQSGALAGALIGLVGGGIAVQLAGWRAAFFMWIPIGLVVALFVFRQPEPRRGDQDTDFEVDLAESVAARVDQGEVAVEMLPEPVRVGTLDYEKCGWREAAQELLHIRSMWFGVLAITVSQLLLTALQFWGVPYFKRVHHLNAAAAGGVAGLLGLGAVVGIVGGGFLADRLLRRGVLCARVYVVAFGSVIATAILVPAFDSTNLAVSAPLLFLGGAALTLPVAPAEAMMTDVVVAQLRGRAATIRGIVRSLGNGGAVIVGGLSSLIIGGGVGRADALRYAIVAITPIYAIGGIITLIAARYYPADVAFVVAESRRLRSSGPPENPEG
jgi:MFS family permease